MKQHHFQDLPVQTLEAAEMASIEGGILPAGVYVVGGYLLKTVADHWGAFKDGFGSGFDLMWDMF